jgi:hypothetical protein
MRIEKTCLRLKKYPYAGFIKLYFWQTVQQHQPFEFYLLFCHALKPELPIKASVLDGL